MTIEPTKLDLLLQELEDLHRAGAPISVADLCQATPDLLSDLERRWAERKAQLIETCSILREDTSPETKSFIHDPDTKTHKHSSITAATKSSTYKNSRSRFQVEFKHDQGGLGVIYRAHDCELHRSVAYKQIKPAKADDPKNRARFIREAEITGGLEHPGIVPIYSLGADEDGRPFYAMRFIQGKCLQDAVHEFHDNRSLTPAERTLEFRKLLSCFIGVCQTLAYAHSKCILHRDLKPANIMLGEFGETLVVDWGLAKRFKELEPPPSLTTTSVNCDDDLLSRDGLVIGTPQYMAPEQAAGEVNTLTPACDIFALGATLFFLLTNKAPFQGKDAWEIVANVRDGKFSPPTSIDSTIPKPLEAICLKAMAISPTSRYETAKQLAEEIERFLADEIVIAYSPTVVERILRWARNHVILVTSVVVALFVLSLCFGEVWTIYTDTQKEHLTIAEMSEIVRREPSNVAAYLARGDAHLLLGRFADAIADANQALQVQPSCAAALELRGVAMAQTGEAQSSIDDLSAAIELDNKAVKAYFRRAQLYNALGKSTAALEDVQKALSLNATFTDAYLLRSQLRKKLGDLNGAAEDRRLAATL